MRRLCLLLLACSCRIGFEPVALDGGVDERPVSITCVPGMKCSEEAPSGSDFVVSCAPGERCAVDCTRAATCSVHCFGTECEVACGDSCSVAGCIGGSCTVTCHGEPATYLQAFATCP